MSRRILETKQTIEDKKDELNSVVSSVNESNIKLENLRVEEEKLNSGIDTLKRRQDGYMVANLASEKQSNELKDVILGLNSEISKSRSILKENKESLGVIKKDMEKSISVNKKKYDTEINSIKSKIEKEDVIYKRLLSDKESLIKDIDTKKKELDNDANAMLGVKGDIKKYELKLEEIIKKEAILSDSVSNLSNLKEEKAGIILELAKLNDTKTLQLGDIATLVADIKELKVEQDKEKVKLEGTKIERLDIAKQREFLTDKEKLIRKKYEEANIPFE